MKLQYDREIDIATASTRLSKRWKNRKWMWSALVEKCASTTRTHEKAAEYARMSKEEQSNIKDVGGFVGGFLNDGIRKGGNVAHRSCATLDIDYGTLDLWEDFTMMYDMAAMLYSTHKHSSENPRYRLVFPLSRDVTPEEYEPLCRRIADQLGIDLFDDSTFELPRLFYWPSTSKDADYVFEYQDGPICDVDAILSTYHNYRDASSWPLSSRVDKAVTRAMKRAGDPLEKPGIIGAFCRTYSIEDAIEQFLPEVYTPTAQEGRYTYLLGSVSGGLVCYDGKFAYSHHATDPAGRCLCNAFDLVRIHLFGAEDEGHATNDVTRLPSFARMQDFAASDSSVRKVLTQEQQKKAAEDFGDLNEVAEDDDTWMEKLEHSRSGRMENSSRNIMLILDNDPNLKGRLWHDQFTGFDLVKGGLPWNKKATYWGSKDDANLRIYLENNYNITGKDKIKDAKDAILTKYSCHPIREYLSSLVWDGVPRLDTLIIDFLGADDTPLNRAITRKHFTAAVKRVFEPGCKYDYCLIMTGAEGVGKSTLLRIMGGDWFNDSITTTEGKEGMEQLRRAWLAELAELASIKRSEVEQVKGYISRQVDIYRAAYAATVDVHPRQCVFSGTTNEDLFLKGDTGNRRFWVIKIRPELRKYSSDTYQEELELSRDQLWAEAVVRWKSGEQLYLPATMEAEARRRQTEFNDAEDDPMRGLLEEFLNTKLPVDWNTWDLNRRRAYYNHKDPLEAEGVEVRKKVCAMEFMSEVLRRNPSDSDYKYLARKVTKMIEAMPDWVRVNSIRFEFYGTQRGFKRIEQPTEEDL